MSRLNEEGIRITIQQLSNSGLEFGFCYQDNLLVTDQVPYHEIASLRPYFTLLRDNIQNQFNETPEIIKGLLRAFSYSIISKTYQSQPYHEEEPVANPSRNKQLFNSFMELVKQYHTRYRGVKFYADKLCLTPNYLSGVVKD